MAYTFLQALNSSLKKVREIQGVSGELTSLTDSARQAKVDVMIDSWNEVVQEVLSYGAYPTEVSEGEITLVADQREYDTADDFETFVSKRLINQTDGYIAYEYPGGYDAMWRTQTQPDSYTGSPQFWALNSTTGKVRLDTSPTANEAGRVYKYLYNRRIAFDEATDTFPFSDTVVDALVPAVAEVYRRDIQKTFDAGFYQASVARALRLLPRVDKGTRY